MRAFGHAGLGAVYTNLGYAAPALAHLERSRQLFVEIGRVRAQGAALYAIGVVRSALLDDTEGAIAATARESELRLDFDASKQWIQSTDLRAYRVLHIAAHGLVDEHQSELSGLVLSMVDRDGSARDGFLQLDEVYRLRLDADLVVLSACETALGQTFSGEGIVGLTRAFLHAGARRVLSTLWAVNDRATGELLNSFYRAYLRDGNPPARALVIAQRETARRFPSPADWAGFTLHGLE